jgi:betaine-aldehyde dehydrogenase
MTDTIRNFIDGELVASATTDFIDLVDPATGERDGRSPVSTHDEVDRAYAAAERASASW